jgi:hypothetical protein
MTPAGMTRVVGKDGAMGDTCTEHLADISVPPLLYQRMGLAVPVLFRSGPVVELKTGQTR